MINRVREADNLVPIRHVLLSVSDKTGLDGFVEDLVKQLPQVRLYSTGGTFSLVKEVLGARWAENLTSVSDYTGQPEMQGGLVKTLDFKIYLGLLSETANASHRADLQAAGAAEIDMVVCNLYPFERTVEAAGATIEDARANIDIGGPSMLRAAAKNFLRVAALCDPDDYGETLARLKTFKGCLGLTDRFALAKKAFSRVADYDCAIVAYLASVDREVPLGHYARRDGGR